jgi:hypothetical protein
MFLLSIITANSGNSIWWPASCRPVVRRLDYRNVTALSDDLMSSLRAMRFPSSISVGVCRYMLRKV